MLTFEFLFGVSLGSLVLRHSDKLSKTSQHQSLSAAEGQHLAKLSVDVLRSLHQPEQFKNFYQRVLLDQECFTVNPPALPCKRSAPCQLQLGCSEGYFHASVEDHYRQVHYEALDLVIDAITNRFVQRGYQAYRNLQDLLLKASSG